MLGIIKHYAGVTCVYLKMSILTVLEYPANILGWLLSNPIQFIVGFATIKFVVAQFGAINGWNYGQLAFLYGLAVISHALSMILFVRGWFMGALVVEGEFDRYILRPMSVLYQFFFTCFNLIGITDLIPGICVFAYGCVKVHFVWSFGNVIKLILLLIGATLIRGGVYLMLGSTSFWTKGEADYGAYTQELFDKTTMYPLSIYPEGVQFLFTYLIPIGWVSFYPASEMLDIATGNFVFQGAAWMTVFIGGLTFAAAAFIFHRGLRKYESAGN